MPERKSASHMRLNLSRDSTLLFHHATQRSPGMFVLMPLRRQSRPVLPFIKITAKNSKGEILPRTDMPAIASYQKYGNLGNDKSITLTFTVQEDIGDPPLDEESGGTITFNDFKSFFFIKFIDLIDIY